MFTQNSLLTKVAESIIPSWAVSTQYSLNTLMSQIVNVRVLLKCKIAADGYSVGDYADLSAQNGAGSSNGAGCCVAIISGFVVVLASSSGFGIRNKTTGVGVVVTLNANYDLVIRAYGH